MRRAGYKVDLFERFPGKRRLAKYDCIIFVKPTTQGDLVCANEATRLGIPIILDLCDDVFLPSYGHADNRPGVVCRLIAQRAVAISTTGPVLAAKLRAMSRPTARVIEISDPFDDETSIASIHGEFRADFIRARLDRLNYRLRGLLGKGGHRLSELVKKAPRAPAWAKRKIEWAMQKSRSKRVAKHVEIIPQNNTTRLTISGKRASRQTIALSENTRPSKTIVWFGTWGAPYADFGIRTLNSITEPLKNVAADIPIKLLVISNKRDEFERVTADFAFPCEYREWSPDTILTDIDEADVCVIPNSKDLFSIGKSANRHVLALSRGVPVVATPVPALEPIAPFIFTGPWEEGIRLYIDDSGKKPADAEAGRSFVLEHYSPRAIVSLWLNLINEVVLPRPVQQSISSKAPIVVFLSLIQDLDVALPLILRLKDDKRFALSVCITDWLNEISPRTSKILLAHSIFPEIVSAEDIVRDTYPSLSNAKAVVTACETSHPAHKLPFVLTRSASGRGIPTYTLQHGFENIGLTYFEPDPDYKEQITFASSTIFTWGPVEHLPKEVEISVQARCVGVGPTKPSSVERVMLPLSSHSGPVVGIFENLHWYRYSEEYRLAVIDDLLKIARNRPDTLFLLKPHHAGMWLVKNAHLMSGAPENIVLADPTNPTWEPYTGASIISSVDAVITTPSTIALDAARIGCPVAVLGYGLELPLYDPLTILETQQDWLGFLDAATSGSSALRNAGKRFAERHVIEGDSVGRIISKIAEDIGALHPLSKGNLP